MTIPSTIAKARAFLQRIVARLFSIDMEDRERCEREKRNAFIDGQRSIVITNELLGLQAIHQKTDDGRQFTALVPPSGHAMLYDGSLYTITYSAQCPVNAHKPMQTPVMVPPGAVVFVAIKADDEDILNNALGIGGEA
ncbi:MAG: hypothetical protein JSS51_07710 [Planctomycetes bacterium]|nr:hypothetical protein [Planctomycetota bacterium]